MRFARRILFMLACILVEHSDALANTLLIDVEWPAEKKERAIYCLQNGGLPNPIIFGTDRPVDLLPAKVDIASPARFDIGTPQIAERPLWTVTVDPGGSEAEVQVTQLSVSSDPHADLVIEGVQVARISAKMEPGGEWRLALPSGPMEALLALAETHSRCGSPTGPQQALGRLSVGHRIGNDFVPPIVSLPNVKGTAQVPSPVGQGIMISWWDRMANTFSFAVPESLQLESMPSGAAILVNGTQTELKTNVTLSVDERAWRYIFLEKAGYQRCRVDASKIKKLPGGGSKFVCVMIKK